MDMLNKIRSNKQVRRAIEDLALLGRQSVADLEAGEKSDLTDAVMSILSQDDVAEIIVNKVDEIGLHEILSEAVLAKDSLHRNDALYEIVPAINRYLILHFEDLLDDMFNQMIADINESRAVKFLNHHIFNNRFTAIQGGLR